MRIIRTTFLTLLAIFLLSGCGMPTYHDFDSSVSIRRRISSVPGIDQRYDAGFRVNINWGGDSYLDDLDSQSPSVLLMYSITGDRGSLQSTFNRAIGGSNNYNNGRTATFNDNGQLEDVTVTVDGAEISLYSFTDETGSHSNPPTYTFGPFKRTDVSGNTIPYYYFMFRREDSSDGNGFYFILDIYTGDGSTSNLLESHELYRSYGGQAGQLFFNSLPDMAACTNTDYNYYSTTENHAEAVYQVNFFLSVNLLPGSNSTQSNNFWSDLSYDYYSVQ